MANTPTSKSSYRNLWSITRGHRTLYVLATLCSTLAIAGLMAVPVIAMYAIDVVENQDFGAANKFLLQLANYFGAATPFASYLVISAIIGVIVTTLASVLQFLRGRLSAVASEGFAKQLRESLYDRTNHAQAKFFDHEEVGDLVQRCTSDVETLRQFMHNDVDALARALLLVFVMVPILLWRHPTLTFYSVMLLPIIVAGGIVFFRFVAKLFRAADEAEGKLTAVLQENLTGVRVVQAFAREEFEYKRFDRENQNFRDKYIRMTNYESWYWGISDFVCTVQISIVTIGGGYLLAQGQLSTGELLLFVTLASIVVWRIRQLIDVVERAGKTLVSLERVQYLLNAEQEPVQERPKDLRTRGRIVFSNVSLAYNDTAEHIKNIDLTIEPGEKIGLVGPPGSGKSTLIRALLRFYPIKSGSILLDGKDIHSIDVDWLRQQLACVLQEPFLFSRTVRENLLLGKRDAVEQELVDATRKSLMHETITGFPNGYDTRIGERGVNLSGGQRQRLALARALVTKAPVLILDDVLSGVDTHTENEILANLANKEHQPTTIIVAHRLTTIRNVDRIVVMEQGRIVQVGSHAQLFAEPGPYRELCDIQGLLDESIQYETELAANG
ncbi:MAG: ABC transporter ATP-binding protein [Gammaproteobacteria bacterium]|nr:ABC transporter ATP-binding protein [Gammaproteobacteria bacterium]MYF39202.1 ABC transporter ATP-binding protein [Gammaproteobacteria bacterium]